MNLRQDFRMVKKVLLEQQWMFNKKTKTEEARVYKERSYNRSMR